MNRKVYQYDNDYINKFLDRCHSYPRESVEFIKPNVIKVVTAKTH